MIKSVLSSQIGMPFAWNTTLVRECDGCAGLKTWSSSLSNCRRLPFHAKQGVNAFPWSQSGYKQQSYQRETRDSQTLSPLSVCAVYL